MVGRDGARRPCCRSRHLRGPYQPFSPGRLRRSLGFTLTVATIDDDFT